MQAYHVPADERLLIAKALREHAHKDERLAVLMPKYGEANTETIRMLKRRNATALRLAGLVELSDLDIWR